MRQIGKRIQLSENFFLDRLACKCGCAMPKPVLENIQDLVSNVQVMRDYLGVPIYCTCGYRCESHNAQIGGASGSQHLYGRAMDLWVPGWEGRYLVKLFDFAIEAELIRQGGLGSYKQQRSLLHYDIRGEKARWVNE